MRTCKRCSLPKFKPKLLKTLVHRLLECIRVPRSLALKANVVEQDEDQDHEYGSYLNTEELMSAHRDYVALIARTFWKNPSKSKAQVEKKYKSSGYKEGNPKMKT